VSLLERLGRSHLSDQEFARLWADGSGHAHLDACAACRERYATFSSWLLGVGDTLRAEADEAFPAERLAIQQAQIARRLEVLERPARVIVFPKAARAVISGNSHVRRWVSVAAAAGLIAGVGLGQVVPSFRTVVREKAATAPSHFTAPVAEKRAVELSPASTSISDEELLSDAFTNPRVKNLSALDDMTPSSRDYTANPK
jgi:hypothetical protein